MNAIVTARVFAPTTYNAVGRVVGYIVAPLSLAGLALPASLYVSRGFQIWLGAAFLVLAGVGLAGNLYLSMRRLAVAGSASPFPLIVSMAGVPAVFTLAGGVTMLAVLGGLAVLVIDVLGPAVFIKVVGKRLVPDAGPPPARPN